MIISVIIMIMIMIMIIVMIMMILQGGAVHVGVYLPSLARGVVPSARREWVPEGRGARGVKSKGVRE